MGQCIACGTVKIHPNLASENANKELGDLRITVVNHLHRLHRIALECTSGIDTCVDADLKQTAILLKYKQVHIKARSKSLQTLVKNIDEVLTLEKNSKKKDVITDGTKTIRDLECRVLADNVKKILENNQEFNDDVMEEIMKLQWRGRDIEEQIEKRFAEKAVNPTNGNRKRYVRVFSP